MGKNSSVQDLVIVGNVSFVSTAGESEIGHQWN